MADSLKLERKQMGNAHAESRVLCRGKAQVRMPGEPSHGPGLAGSKALQCKEEQIQSLQERPRSHGTGFGGDG